MIKIWDLNYRGDGLGNSGYSENGGRCKEQVVVQPDSKVHEKLMSKADAFKNLINIGNSSINAVKRNIFASAIKQRCKGGPAHKHQDNDHGDAFNPEDYVVALCDNAGIVQINNLFSGNLLFSMTNKKNKLVFSALDLVDQEKVFVVGGGMDGTVIFFFRPSIDYSKETQTGPSDDSCVIRKDVHEGEIVKIAHTHEHVVIGGSDNHLSVWKTMGQKLLYKIKLPGTDVSISDFNFISFKHFNGLKYYNVEYIMVLQSNGNFQLCKTDSETILVHNIIQSGLSNGKFAISQATKLNQNGIFVADYQAREGITYRFDQKKTEKEKKVVANFKQKLDLGKLGLARKGSDEE